MINKDYKRLTTGGYTNPKMLPQYRDRLCYLEDCIENDKLVFLPKIGQTIWVVESFEYDGKFCVEVTKEVINEIHINDEYEVSVSVVDGHGDIWHSGWFATKEEAENYAEKLRKFKERQQWKNS